MRLVGFQMWESYRQVLLAEQRFYIEQAQQRLLSQFNNIEAEADKAAKAYLENMSIHFNPDQHDSSDFYEAAHDESVGFYQLLTDMHESTRLSVVAGMFHQWDKKLRDWMVRETHHWHRGEHVTKLLWKADFAAIVEFLVAIGFDVKSFHCYEHLNAMRLVVNVFKHGNGSSFDELRASYPAFIYDPFTEFGVQQVSIPMLDHTSLRVTDAHLSQFSEAILDFWQAIPEKIYLELEEELDLLKFLRRRS